MNKKLILLPLAVVAMGLTSCNSATTDNWHLKRDAFTETNFDTARKVFNQMARNRVVSPEDRHSLLENYMKEGSVSFKASLDLDGTVKYAEEPSIHYVDLSMIYGLKISWSCDKKYVKINGEKENIYFLKDGTDIWRCNESLAGYSEKKTRTKIEDEDDIKEFNDDFGHFVIHKIGEYSVIFIPYVLSISAGITGYATYDGESYSDHEYSIAQIFDNDIHTTLSNLVSKYEASEYKSKGYYLNLTYASDGVDTVSANAKGKISMEDISTSGDNGYSEIDIFTSYRNNYVMQHEFNVKGKRIKNDSSSNLTYQINTVQETKKDDYQHEEIDLSQYKIEK